jgi:hypothetical protein
MEYSDARLTVKAHDAFDELAKYMVEKVAEAGVDLPPEGMEAGLKLLLRDDSRAE